MIGDDDMDWQDAMIREQAALIVQRDEARKDAEGWKDVAAEWERAFHNERREADRPCACCARNHAPVGPPRRTRIYHAPTGGTGVCPRCGVTVTADARDNNTWVSADESQWNCTDAL